MFTFRWPDGFVPEDYGWEAAVRASPPLVWLRWQIPFRFAEALCRLPEDSTGAAGIGFMPGDGFPVMASSALLYAAVKREFDYRGADRG